MPSPAGFKFSSAAERAILLRVLVKQGRTRALSRGDLQLYYHASLAANVAAWDAYVKNLLNDFFAITTNTFDPKYHAMHTSLRDRAVHAVRRFNTPNWENSRNIITWYTGYDPINNWIWPAKGMNVQHVKLRLDEVLQVRHSFAHGFALPTFSWTQSATGKVRLTAEQLQVNEGFFGNLVRRTDRGLSQHIARVFGITTHW